MQFEDEFKESQPLIEAKIESENKEEISGEETTETVEELDKQQEEHSSYGYDSSEHMNDGDLDGGVDSKVPELEQQESESSTNIYRDLYGTNTQDDWVKKLYEAKNRYLESQGKEQPESAVVSTDATAPIARVERMVTTIKVADKQLEPFLVASEDFDSSGLLISDLEFEPWGDKNKRNGGKRKFEQIEGTEKQGEKENGGIESINSGKGTTIPLDELSTSDIYWTRFVNKVSNNIINKLADFVSKENFKPVKSHLAESSGGEIKLDISQNINESVKMYLVSQGLGEENILPPESMFLGSRFSQHKQSDFVELLMNGWAEYKNNTAQEDGFNQVDYKNKGKSKGKGKEKEKGKDQDKLQREGEEVNEAGGRDSLEDDLTNIPLTDMLQKYDYAGGVDCNGAYQKWLEIESMIINNTYDFLPVSRHGSGKYQYQSQSQSQAHHFGGGGRSSYDFDTFSSEKSFSNASSSRLAGGSRPQKLKLKIRNVSSSRKGGNNPSPTTPMTSSAADDRQAGQLLDGYGMADQHSESRAKARADEFIKTYGFGLGSIMSTKPNFPQTRRRNIDIQKLFENISSKY